jgi:predicted PurR-regulated permease PerM
VSTSKLPLSHEENEDLHVARPAERDEVARSESRALTWLAAVACAVIAWIVMPVSLGILLGTLMAFSLQPLYERWKPRLGPASAALTTVLAATVGLIAAFGGLGWLVVAKGSTLARALIAALGPGGGASRAIGALGLLTTRLGISPQELETRLRGVAEAAAARAAGVAETLVAATASSLLTLFFAMLTMYVILRNWLVIALRAQETMPLRPDYTRALFDEFRRVGRTTLLGTIVTGLSQGVLAMIGYWITGVPEPVFFGAVTAIASLIPAVGTLLVWVPAGIVLIVTGHPLGGIMDLIWGAAVIVGVSDYVVRPRLVGGEVQMPALATFAALLGGVEAFGLKGLILGPVLMSLGIAVLRIYAKEVRELRAAVARMNH